MTRLSVTTLVARYASFAVLATIANLGAQRLVLVPEPDGVRYALAVGTGTVVGCFMVRHGLSGERALAELATLWPAMEKSWYFRRTPQTDAQHAYVRRWPLRV